MKKSQLCVTPPIEDEKIRIQAASETAAGWPALWSSARHALGQMNLRTCTKTLFQVNQMGGFDCPGCAWPDPDDHRSGLGEYCENGVKAVAEEATAKRIRADFFQKYSLTELSHWSDYQLGKSGRLTEPMIKRQGSEYYEPISWEKAFEAIAQELNGLDHPNEAIFYTSGRTSNEAAFLYQLFVRQFGTNNLPDCSNMCHESSGVALSETLGIGKGSVKLEDFYLADLVMVIGQNPGTNHPRMLSALKKAKKAGAKIISINPLPETGLIRFKNPQHVSDMLGSGVALADLFLQVVINQDIALLKAIMRLLYDEEQKRPGEVFDWDFIKAHSHGHESFINSLKTVDVAAMAQQCGISMTQIKQAAEMILSSKKIICCWAMGLTQHENGVNNIREVVNLLLLKGSVGKPGAGTCPVRGHSNVQGDRTMGIWEKPKTAFLDQLKAQCGFEPPREHGYDTVGAIKAMAEGKGKVFFAMGGNFLSATPDTEYTAKALQSCRMTIQVSTKLNRSHLVCGEKALILPCLGRTELDQQANGLQFVSVENSMGIVHSSQGKLSPASPQLLSEPMIIARLAEATLGQKTPTKWSWLVADYDRIRDLIESVIPGFTDYNRRVRNEAGFYLPNGAREGKFHTQSKKAQFSLNPVNPNPLKEGQYLMMTIRSHDQFNTTIYGLDDRYRGILNGRRVILMNPEDMKAAGLAQGMFVDLFSHFRGEQREAPHFMVVPFSIPPRCVATYFPEANPLVPIGQTAAKSHTPASKSVIISLKKVES
ncbi:MAG: FdhF/YdeP family oxidoreductase [Bacteroidota bacterium]